MAEFAVAVAVLVMLLAGMPVIHRYHELQIATLEAARLLAFQKTWRVASNAPLPVAAVRRTLLPPTRDPNQPGAQTLDAQFASEATPGRAGTAEAILFAPIALTGGVSSAFGRRSKFFQIVKLRVAVSTPAALPEPFSRVPVTLSAQYALLGNSWLASGPGQVAQRSGALVVTRGAQSWHALTSFGTSLLSLVEPAFRQFCPGQVDPEQVPADRLVRGSATGPVTSWRSQC